MSGEGKIEGLTPAVVNLTAVMQGAAITPNAPAAPVIQQPVAPAAPAAPAAPVFAPPPFATQVPAAPAAPTAPFTDAAGLVRYATDAYTALVGADPGVGAKIQAAFTTLGYQSIEQMAPTHYGEFYSRVESLRG